MKRYDHLYEKIYDLENLRKAHQHGNHFQHAAAAVVLHIARQHKIGVLAIEFDLVQGLFAGEHLGRDAVLTPAGLVPHHMAVTGPLFQRAVRVQCEHLGPLRVQ